MRIKVFCDFATDENIFQHFKKCYKECSSYTFTSDNDYTHAIIINTEMPTLQIPKENVIGLAHEPIPFLNLRPEFIEYAKKHIHKYLIGDNTNLPEPFIEHHGFMMSIPIPPPLICAHLSKKSKIGSIIISKKNYLYGHTYRHILVRAILQTNLPIDIYGRGTSLYSSQSNDKRIKTEFTSTEPYDDYMFHIAIENIQHPEYISEKILLPLSRKTNVIYWGASNITNVLKEQPIYILTGNIKHDIHKISIICENASRLYKEPNLEQLEEDTHIKNAIKFFKTT